MIEAQDLDYIKGSIGLCIFYDSSWLLAIFFFHDEGFVSPFSITWGRSLSSSN